MPRVLCELRVVIVVLSALLLAADVVLAQGGSTAQISGTVKDESGGVLPGADVSGRVVDLALARAFKFATSQTFEARVEAFNVFNWFRPASDKTPLQAPIVTVNSQTFGQILEAADPRIMQFAVKFSF